MPKLLMIADDLTGALDAGVQLAKRGIDTVVAPALEDLDRNGECEALVINTETRHVAPKEAAERVARAIEIGKKRGVEFFYKKTDSTLRGNIGKELEALLRASGEQRLIFIPAFPRLGRTTRGGRQYVNGVELHRTEYANDRLNPIRSADIGELIRAQSAVPVHSLGVAQLTSGNGGRGGGICVVDCESDAELDEICRAVKRSRSRKALAGSAGFADCLAEVLELAMARPPERPQELPERMLVVNGSLHPSAARQISRAEAAGFAVVRIDAEVLTELSESSVDPWEQVAGAVQTVSSADVVVTPTAPAAVHGDSVMLNFAENLGSITAAILQRSQFRLLMVIGGDTLAGVIRALGCRTIVPLLEIEPGVALSRCETRVGEIFLVSKAGGFGGEDILPVVREWVRRVPR